MPTRVQPVPHFQDYSQEQTSSPETCGAMSYEKFSPCFQEQQIMAENKNLEKQASQNVPHDELPWCYPRM